MIPLTHFLSDYIALPLRVSCHVEAYYAEIRRQLELNRDFSAHFPDFHKGQRRVMAILGSDGIVVAHYFAGENYFAFTMEDRPSADIMDRVSGMAVRGNGPITGLSWYCDERRSCIAFASMGERDNLAIAEWSSDLSTRRWSQEAGTQQARYEVFSRLTAKLLGVQKSEPKTVQDTLEGCIHAFRLLLDTNPGEEKVQVFLKDNPVLLHPVAVKITPKVKLGSQLVTDFVVELINEEYILVEIEAPHHKLFTKSGDLTAPVNHAVRQVTDWKQWIIENGSYARTNIPELSKAYDPDGLVILGRRPDSAEDRTRLRRTNKDRPAIPIQTYDDLLQQAEVYLRNLRIYLAPRPVLSP